jgi:hypothetical protein
MLNEGNQILNFISSSGSVPQGKKLRFRFRFHNTGRKVNFESPRKKENYSLKLGFIPKMFKMRWFFFQLNLRGCSR